MGRGVNRVIVIRIWDDLLDKIVGGLSFSPLPSGKRSRNLTLTLAPSLFTESLMFYYEVKEFESGNYLAPEYGTMIFAAATADDSERQFLRAEKLCKKYVADDARFQINVPSGIRDKILEKYKGGKAMITKDMFRDATDNLYKMLEHDKFDRFKRHALYTHYKRCASTKFMKRKFKVH